MNTRGTSVTDRSRSDLTPGEHAARVRLSRTKSSPVPGPVQPPPRPRAAAGGPRSGDPLARDLLRGRL